MKRKIVFSLLILAVAMEGFAQYDSLNINNINARFYPDGLMFDDGNSSHFEVPNGSGKHTIFSASLWIGGLDESGQVHLAADRFRTNERDWFSGPLNYNGECDSINYNRIWNIDRGSLDSLITWYNNPGALPLYYTPPAWVEDFPAVGNVSEGYSPFYFPFYDANGDGWYSSSGHDYPIMKGDQSLFYIFNDACGEHTNTHTDALGIEVRAQAYAFDCTEDSALYNTIFVHYDIVNISNQTYYNTWIGLWSDMDLGEATDDYIACDVTRGAYYTYNGDNVDGSGGPSHYGEHPPAQAVVFLGGPYQDADGIDNAIGIDTNQSLNGLGYGDGIVDNERLGMARFVYHNNEAGVQGDPQTGAEHYNYMRGFWRDGTQMMYGGTGHVSSCTSCEPAAFMFPDNSDQQFFWGTNGSPVVPWSEVTSGNTPSDRRGLGSVGPFTFEPGEVQPLDIAFVFGRDYNGGPAESVENMKERIDAIREMFINDSIPSACGGSFTGIASYNLNTSKLKIYPNPAIDLLNIELPDKMGQERQYQIMDITGRVISSGVLGESNAIDINGISSGIYILQMDNLSGVFIKR